MALSQLPAGLVILGRTLVHHRFSAAPCQRLRFSQRMPTYDNFGKYAGVRRSCVYVKSTLKHAGIRRSTTRLSKNVVHAQHFQRIDTRSHILLVSYSSVEIHRDNV